MGTTKSSSFEGNRYQSLLVAFLRPVVRFCLRNAVQYQELHEALKTVFVQEAQRELAKVSASGNVSRLSAATGLQRKDIRRLLDQPTVEASSLLSKVLGQWQFDRNFLDSKKQPRVLRYGGKHCEFSKLVNTVSSDLNPGTIFFELERLKAVSRIDNCVRLDAKVLQLRGELNQALHCGAQEAENLFRSIEENFDGHLSTPNLHATTEFTNIRLSALPTVRNWLLGEGSKLHARARHFLSGLDDDYQKLTEPAGARVQLTTFSLIDTPEGKSANT